MTGLDADRAQIEAFVHTLFPYADDGTFISLRAFDQFDRRVPPIVIDAVKVAT